MHESEPDFQDRLLKAESVKDLANFYDEVADASEKGMPKTQSLDLFRSIEAKLLQRFSDGNAVIKNTENLSNDEIETLSKWWMRIKSMHRR